MNLVYPVWSLDAGLWIWWQFQYCSSELSSCQNAEWDFIFGVELWATI